MQGPVSTWLGDRQGNPRNRRAYYIVMIPTKFTRFRLGLLGFSKSLNPISVQRRWFLDSDEVWDYKIPIKFTTYKIPIKFTTYKIPTKFTRFRLSLQDSDEVCFLNP